MTRQKSRVLAPARFVNYPQMTLDDALPPMTPELWSHWLRCPRVPIDCRICMTSRTIIRKAQLDAGNV